MGRPIGSVNREKPFSDALRVALRSRPLALRRVADQLIDRAEAGNLAYIHELIDRLDGKPIAAVDVRNVPADQLSTAELIRIATGGRLGPDAPPELLHAVLTLVAAGGELVSEAPELLLEPPAKVRSNDLD
jgi:hypothetical protein